MEAVKHSDNDLAEVAYLRIKKAHLVPKDPLSSGVVPIPILLQDSFERTEQILRSLKPQSNPPSPPQPTPAKLVLEPVCRRIGNWIGVANIHGYNDSPITTTPTLEDEVVACFRSLSSKSKHFLVEQTM